MTDEVATRAVPPTSVPEPFSDVAQHRESVSLGMWLFLTTEFMMFGGLFFAYTLYRIAYPVAFRTGSHHLNVTIGTINTFILLASSLTMALAVHATAAGHRREAARFLAGTLALGVGFLVLKGFEWAADYREGLIPALRWTYFEEHRDATERLVAAGGAPYQVEMFFVLFFSMTGLHPLHLVIGALLLLLFLVAVRRGLFLGARSQPVEMLGLYWHFVDLVWIFLYPLLYLLGGLRRGI